MGATGEAEGAEQTGKERGTEETVGAPASLVARRVLGALPPVLLRDCCVARALGGGGVSGREKEVKGRGGRRGGSRRRKREKRESEGRSKRAREQEGAREHGEGADGRRTGGMEEGEGREISLHVKV